MIMQLDPLYNFLVSPINQVPNFEKEPESPLTIVINNNPSTEEATTTQLTAELPSVIFTSNDKAKTRKPHKRWTAREDQKLHEYIKVYGEGHWTQIASCFPNATRDAQNCMERWNNFLNPNISKDEWNEAEEKKLKKLHEKLGTKWTEIGKQLPTPQNKVRSAFQCRTQWEQMNKSDTTPVKKIQTWTDDQDVTLAGLVSIFRNQWTLIAKHQSAISKIHRNDLMCRRHWDYLNKTRKVPLTSNQQSTVSASTSKTNN